LCNIWNILQWLEYNTEYIKIEEVQDILKLFNLNDVPELKNCLKTKIINSDVNISNLKKIMEKEDFIFVY
jgi:hypothetical protein